MATNIWLREDMAHIHAGVIFPPGTSKGGQSLPLTTSWTTLEGGIIEASNVFTRPGGMLPGLAIGGIVERSDITVTRQYTKDLAAFVVAMEDLCGNGSAWAAFRMLNRQKNEIGPWIHYSGILKSVVRTNLDANNSAAAFLGLVIALDQEAVSNNKSPV